VSDRSEQLCLLFTVLSRRLPYLPVIDLRVGLRWLTADSSCQADHWTGRQSWAPGQGRAELSPGGLSIIDQFQLSPGC